MTMLANFMQLLLLVVGSSWAHTYEHHNQTDAVLKIDHQHLTDSQDDIQYDKDTSVLNVTIQGIPNILNYVDSVCFHPFQSIGNGCYYFSDDSNVERDFDGAIAYCDGLSHGHATSEVTLAMLDYDNDEDLAVLDAISTM
ncbi:unnamed protein product, partial [Meganyctiphanes norvegica]